VSDAAVTIQVKSNPLADSVAAALVIEADPTNRHEDRPTGKGRGAVFLGAAFFAKSSPVGGRLFNFAFDRPLNQATNPLPYLHPSGKGSGERSRTRSSCQASLSLLLSPRETRRLADYFHPNPGTYPLQGRGFG
jgi:hypothetical protein